MSHCKNLRDVILLPVLVAGLVPAAILLLTGTDTFALWPSAPILRLVLLVIGGLCAGLGLFLLVDTIGMFVEIGRGMLGPWDPTQELVQRRAYRYVRNPMMTGVFAVLLGTALLTASLPLFCWFVLFVSANIFYIPQFEEPRLEQQFGEEYLSYKRHVPRWFPRWTPWEDEARIYN